MWSRLLQSHWKVKQTFIWWYKHQHQHHLYSLIQKYPSAVEFLSGKYKWEKLSCEWLLQGFGFSSTFLLAPFSHEEKRGKFLNPVKIAHKIVVLILNWLLHVLSTEDYCSISNNTNVPPNKIFSDKNGNPQKYKSLVTASADILRSIDTNINPCQDFYAFSCNKWIENHPVPKVSFSKICSWNKKNTLPCKNMNQPYSIRMYSTNFWQPTIHLQQNI